MIDLEKLGDSLFPFVFIPSICNQRQSVLDEKKPVTSVRLSNKIREVN